MAVSHLSSRHYKPALIQVQCGACECEFVWGVWICVHVLQMGLQIKLNNLLCRWGYAVCGYRCGSESMCET